MPRKITKYRVFPYFLTILILIFLFLNFNPILESHHDTYFNLIKIDKNTQTSDFKLNPESYICDTSLSQEKSFTFIAFVILAPHHFEKRHQIRSTWGNKILSSDFRLIFTIGLSEDEIINKKVKKEYENYRDIVQIDNFIDSYYNMTFKIMKSFKWISKYCSNAKYILRLNDDVIVNTFSLVEHFKSIPHKMNHIYGNAFYETSPIRIKDHKFFISEREYSKSKYDDYVDGQRKKTFS